MVQLVSPEDLLVERILISVYPSPYEPGGAMCPQARRSGLSRRRRDGLDRSAEACGPARISFFPALKKMVAAVAMSSENQTPTTPERLHVSWKAWLMGRHARRQTGNKVAPTIIRRVSSSSDKRLHKLYGGNRGLPFVPTDELADRASQRLRF